MISILLPDLRGGGAERVNLDLAQEFARAGHDVEFVLMQARGELLEEAGASFSVVDLAIPAPAHCLRARPLPAPAPPRCVARRNVAADRDRTTGATPLRASLQGTCVRAWHTLCTISGLGPISSAAAAPFHVRWLPQMLIAGSVFLQALPPIWLHCRG